jgi:carboxymethylenebutenolidase
MCDEHYENDVEKNRLRSGLSRREFAAMTAAAGLSILLPHAAEAAVDVKEEEVNIKTPDGTADAYFVHPATGTGAAVIVWPDILGLRPAYRTMGKRLAQEGLFGAGRESVL